MDYYYHDGNQACGPVDEEGLRALISTGTISADTHVWREGMAEWQRLGELMPDLLPPADATDHSGESPSAAEEINFVVCSQCQRTQREEDTFRIQGKPICASCKPVYMQRLREGVSSLPSEAERHRILGVARSQKGILLCILAIFATGLVAAAFPQRADGSPHPIFVLATLAILISGAVFIYRLTAALGFQYPLLWTLASVLLCYCGGMMLLLLFLSYRSTRYLREAGFKVSLLGANVREINSRLQTG